MQLSSLFSRAWQQKYLTPAERAIYKFVVALIVLVPSGLILSGVDGALSWLHMSIPPLLWQVLAVLLPAILLAFAKYAGAHGDVAVGAIIHQVELRSEQDLTTSTKSVTTSAYTPPKPIILPPASADQPKPGA